MHACIQAGIFVAFPTSFSLPPTHLTIFTPPPSPRQQPPSFLLSPLVLQFSFLSIPLPSPSCPLPPFPSPQIRILQQLKSTLEAQSGAALPLGPDEVLPPIAARHGKERRGKDGGRGGGKVGERGGVGRGRGERRGGEGRRSERKVWRRGDDKSSGGEEGGRE
ncbi:unnamed protein product [Closterium sp. NIES-54]